MAGCQNKQNAAVTDTTAVADENSEIKTSEVTGRVTEISDTEITLSTGGPGREDRGGRNEGGGERSRNDDGKKPDGKNQKPDGNKQKSGEEDKKPDRESQKTEGDNRGQDEGSRKQPGKDGENESIPEQENEDQEHGAGKPSGESGGEMPESRTVTAVLTSSTEFLNEENSIISVSEIKTGDIVTVEIDSENTAVKVTVTGLTEQRGQGRPGEMDGPGGGYTESETYEAATEHSGDA